MKAIIFCLLVLVSSVLGLREHQTIVIVDESDINDSVNYTLTIGADQTLIIDSPNNRIQNPTIKIAKPFHRDEGVEEWPGSRSTSFGKHRSTFDLATIDRSTYQFTKKSGIVLTSVVLEFPGANYQPFKFGLDIIKKTSGKPVYYILAPSDVVRNEYVGSSPVMVPSYRKSDLKSEGQRFTKSLELRDECSPDPRGKQLLRKTLKLRLDGYHSIAESLWLRYIHWECTLNGVIRTFTTQDYEQRMTRYTWKCLDFPEPPGFFDPSSDMQCTARIIGETDNAYVSGIIYTTGSDISIINERPLAVGVLLFLGVMTLCCCVCCAGLRQISNLKPQSELSQGAPLIGQPSNMNQPNGNLQIYQQPGFGVSPYQAPTGY